MPSAFQNILSSVFGGSGLIKGDGATAKGPYSIFVLSTGVVAGRAMRLLRTVILARILSPSDFGLMAIVALASAALEALTQVGVKQSVIQNTRGAQKAYLNAAFWMQAVRGLGIFLVAMLLAPIISSFFERPELLWLVRVAFIAIIFMGFVSPGAYVLHREYRFGRVVLLEQGSAFLGVLVTVVAAFLIRNVWALVAGFVAEAALLCVFSYILAPFLPSVGIDRDCLRELLKFARGMFGLPVLAMLSFQMDVMMLGKLVSNELLGIYSLALTLVNIPMDFVSRGIGPVLLPMFADRQEDKILASRTVLRLTKVIGTCGLPLAAFLASCAGPVLTIVLGRTFAVAAIPFGFLCTFSFVFAQSVVFSQLYLGLGRPHLHRRFNVVRVIILASLMYPAIKVFGLSGAAGVMLLANSIALGSQVFWVRRLIELKVGDYIRCYLPGLLLSVPIISVVGLLRLLTVSSSLLLLGAGVCSLLATYATAAFVFFKRRQLEAANNKQDIITSCTGVAVPGDA